MNTMTSTQTKTTTNTKLIVATAFLAASAAFAMIPKMGTTTQFQGCVDSDAPVSSPFEQSQLFVKSVTTYNSGSKTDYCQDFPSTGKNYVIEGVCKEGRFQRWQKNCAELNIGKTGVNYRCVEGACVDLLATPTSTPTSTPPTASAPTNLTTSLSCFSATTTQVVLNWIDNTSNETGFEIKRADVIRGNVGANITTFTDILYGTYTPNAVLSYSVGAKTPENTYYSSPVNITLPSVFPCASSTPSSTVSLAVSPTSFSTAALAGGRNISVSSNVSWTVSDNQTWLTVSPTTGSNNGNFLVSYTANTLTTSRTGLVNVTGGGITRTITVTQNAPSSTPTAPTSTYLNAAIDTNYTGLRNDHYVLAGTQKHLAGRVKLNSFGEDVELKDLALNILSASSVSDVENTFDSFTIYQDAAMTVPLASADVRLGTVLFEDVDFVVPKNTTQYLYIGAKLNSVGTGDNGTAVSNVSLNFGLKDAGTTAEGVTSYDDVLPQNLVVTENVYTKVMTAIGAQVTNVATSFPGGTLAGGEQTFFTFAVTANSGVNTDNSGDALDIFLTSLKLQLATDAASVTGIKLCRVSTGNCMNLVTPTLGSSPVALETAAGTGLVQLSGFSNVDDRRIDNGETAQFELRGTFSGVTDKYAQGSLQDVHNSGIVWGYDLNNDNVNDFSFTDLKKMEPRWSQYPDVIGSALVN